MYRFAHRRAAAETHGRDALAHAATARRAAALLEVVVALSILLLAMGVVGLTFHNGDYNVQLADRMTRAAMFTERLLAELEAGILDITEKEQTGWFAEEGPGGESTDPRDRMSWRVETSPHLTLQGVLKVDVYIYMGDPDAAEGDRKTIIETHVLRAVPMGLDFQRDFGMEEEQVTQLTDAVPGGAAILDPTNFDPRQLAQLDLDTLGQILPEILKAFGLNLNPAQMAQIMDMARSGNTQVMEDLAKRLQEQADKQGVDLNEIPMPGGAGDGGGRPGRPPRGDGEAGDGGGRGSGRGEGGGADGGRRPRRDGGGGFGQNGNQEGGGFNQGGQNDEQGGRRRGGGRRGGGQP